MCLQLHRNDAMQVNLFDQASRSVLRVSISVFGIMSRSPPISRRRTCDPFATRCRITSAQHQISALFAIQRPFGSTLALQLGSVDRNEFASRDFDTHAHFQSMNDAVKLIANALRRDWSSFVVLTFLLSEFLRIVVVAEFSRKREFCNSNND